MVKIDGLCGISSFHGVFMVNIRYKEGGCGLCLGAVELLSLFVLGGKKYLQV